MQGHLKAARDEAVALHDAALARHSPNFNAVFALAINEAIEKLEYVIAEAAAVQTTAPIELARTYRWLGDACFDHARFAGRPSLTRAAAAYEKAERLFVGKSASVEQAKLDFNFANTLTALSAGADVGLLEVAKLRYERAATVFRDNHLPQLEGMVAARLSTVRTQLRLAREHAVIQRGYDSVQEKLTRFPNADEIEPATIADEITRATGGIDRAGLMAAVSEAVAAVTSHAQSASGAAPQLAQLTTLLGEFERNLAAEASLQAAVHEVADPLTAMIPVMAAGLVRRIGEDLKAEAVSPQRAELLVQLLEGFVHGRPAPGDDVRAHEQKVARMREIMAQTADTLKTQSWRLPPPLPGSRAERVDVMLDRLEALLNRDMQGPMRPEQEAEAGRELFGRVAMMRTELRQAPHEAGDFERRIAGIEDRVWRLALDTQDYARRYHLAFANPDFAMLAVHAAPRSLFVSGDGDLRAAVQLLAQRDGLQLFLEPRRDDIAQERWSQLIAASVGVFGIGLPDGAARAQICYELGLALALGKPCVIFARGGTNIPFDVEIAPIIGDDDVEGNVRRLRAGVHEALSAVTRGGRTPQLGGGGKTALEALRQHIDRSGAGSAQLSVHLRVAEANAGDAIALKRSLQNIIGSLGADGPALLLPAWPSPPALPVSFPPRCFHVMPLSKPWSDAVRDEVAEACDRHGWKYVRGDESTAQRIVPGIWQDICQASAVVIDITEHNANVALELGLVHVLGRPYRIVAQGDDPSRHAFASLPKTRLHGYRLQAAPGDSAQNEPAPPKSLAEIVVPFLTKLQLDHARG